MNRYAANEQGKILRIKKGLKCVSSKPVSSSSSQNAAADLHEAHRPVLLSLVPTLDQFAHNVTSLAFDEALKQLQSAIKEKGLL